MLSIQGIDQYYGESQTLWDLSLTLEAGALTCLMGRNGVGKTTLLKTLMGLLPARKGSILFDGEELRGKPPEVRARRRIGYVPQGRMIFPKLTVEENLRVALGARKGLGKTIPPRVYDLFPVLREMLHRRGGDLSGGQQQQLAIARALTLDPKLLILDEPTEGIQPNVVRDIGDVLTKLNREEGLAILLVEQKLSFARKVGKNFVIMEKGRPVAQGPIADLNDDVVKRHLAV